MVNPGDPGQRRCQRRDHGGPRRVSMKQIVSIFADQVAYAKGRSDIETVVHRCVETFAPCSALLIHQLGKFSGLHAGEIDRDAVLGQASPQVRLNSFRTRKMLAIDDMQRL